MGMDARKQRILEAIVALYANDGDVAPACWQTTLTWHCPVPPCAMRWPP